MPAYRPEQTKQKDKQMATEMAIAGTHERVMEVLSQAIALQNGMRALDIGAGQGAFSAKLRDAGLAVSACDFVPEQFTVPDIACRRCDLSGEPLPYSDAAFDLAVAVEVLEHIDGHDRFFAEVSRVLTPGGTVLFTTPNILSLKSRVRFLFTGCYYSFGLLRPGVRDPVRQHISPFTLNRYQWLLSLHGLEVCSVETDKRQGTSQALAFLAPFIKLCVTRVPRDLRQLAAAQNSFATLFGRKLILIARKTQDAMR